MIYSRLALLHLIIACFISYTALAQCPSFPTASISGNSGYMCEGDMLTISLTGQNFPLNSTVDFSIGTGMFNPYNGEGDFIGSVPVTSGDCDNEPEVLYVMVNPDNAQVGGGNDKCDEFMVIWTGSGGYTTDDIIVSNLSNGSFQWSDFVAGNEASFTCGDALPPGPVPPNAILIIQGATTNNVIVNSDVLCASGLPVYIIANNNTDCTGGWFDNDSPCSSCPVQIDIDGSDCTFSFDVNYGPPSNSISGWGWSNMGTGVYANVIPSLSFPVYDPPAVTIPDFNWTVPSNFCENYGDGTWTITGIPDPPPMVGCPQIFTPFFDVNVSCPQLMLSGGGDICEGNCPEAPNEIVFTIVGEDLPLEADLQVTASLFPPFAINDLEIYNGQQLFICLDGFLPSFDPSTNTLTVPSFAVGLSATITIVSLVSASGCPVTVDPASITIDFIEATSADAGADQTICSHENAVLDGSMGGSANTASWSTSGDGTFSNSSSLTSTYIPGSDDIANGSVTLTLTTTDENGACIPAQSSMEITIEQSITIETGPPITICNTDVANISAVITGPDQPGEWETVGDGEFDDPNDPVTFYTPGSVDISNGSVTLYYNPVNAGVCVESNEPLVVDIVNAPIVNVPQGIEVCLDDSITIHINVSGNFSDIIWFTNGDGELILINDQEVNYTPGPQDIEDQFTIVSVIVVSAYPACGETTYNLGINVIDCNCPPFETDPPTEALCAGNDMLDLSTLLESGGSGQWTITSAPAGMNPAIVTGNNFITNLSDSGIYEVTYTLNFPDPGCPSTSSELIQVTATTTIDAGSNIANCGPSNVFVNGTIIPASSNVILWETLGDGSFVDAGSLATTYIPGPVDSLATDIILVLHFTDPVCGNQTDTTHVLFPAPPFTIFSNDTVNVCNEAGNGTVINFPSLINGGDVNGVWSNVSGLTLDFSNPSNVNFEGIAPGYYIFNYQTDAAIFPCQEINYPIIVNVEECLCPLIEISFPPGGVCNDQSEVNLAAFVMSGAPGTWSIIQQPSGNNPATIMGSLLQTTNADHGNYLLRFTLDQAPIIGCPDSAEVTIFIQAPSVVTLPQDMLICSNVVDINFSALISGNATDVQWATTGSGAFASQTGISNSYTLSQADVGNGQIIITGTSIDTFGFCAPFIDSMTLSVSNPASTGFSEFITSVCNNPDSGSVVNLQSFIIGGDADGDWVDVNSSGVDLSDVTSVDFNGVTPGTFVFSYTTNDATPPCIDSTYSFTVFVEDCSCPSFLIGTIDQIQCEGVSIDLSTLNIDAAPGIWSVSNGPAGIWPVINGNTLNTDGAAEGDYTIAYVLNDSIPGCPATAYVTMSLESLMYGIISNECDPLTMLSTIIFNSNASDVVSDVGFVSEISAGVFMIDSITPGILTSVSLTTANGNCALDFTLNAFDCSCTLETEDISDTILICPGDTFVLIPFLTGAQGLAFSTWISDETLMRPTLPLFEEYTWIWVVVDSAGCEQRDTFNVAMRELITLEATPVSPQCEGIPDGAIIITDISGGAGPYTVQLDSSPPFISTTFPDTIANVGVGVHNLSITNSDGCRTSQVININSASAGSISLGPDQTITAGDSALIEPDIFNVDVTDFTWSPTALPNTISSFWYSPEQTETITLLVTDSAGCIYQDELLIQVLTDQNIFVPNVFTPNGNSLNDKLSVFITDGTTPIETMTIFDRWGNVMFHTTTLPFEWDGTSRGKDAMSGVYVIRIVYTEPDGDSKIYISDLTLIR